MGLKRKHSRLIMYLTALNCRTYLYLPTNLMNNKISSYSVSTI